MDKFEESSTLTIRGNSLLDEICKETYKVKETFDGMYTCDLIIKSGVDLVEDRAHRIILANASKFLYEALSTAVPGTISVLILPDIEPETLKLILCYIYTGEVTLSNEDLNKFIEGCQYLRIQEPIDKDVTEIQPKVEVPDEPLVDLTSDDDFNVTEMSHLTQILTQISAENTISMVNKKDRKPQKIQNRRRRAISILKLDNSALSKEQRKIALDRAKNCVLFVYETSDRKPDGNLKKIIKKTDLVFEGKNLKKALHKCGFCNFMCSLKLVEKNLTWSLTSLRSHLKTKHGVNNVKSSKRVTQS